MCVLQLVQNYMCTTVLAAVNEKSFFAKTIDWKYPSTGTCRLEFGQTVVRSSTFISSMLEPTQHLSRIAHKRLCILALVVRTCLLPISIYIIYCHNPVCRVWMHKSISWSFCGVHKSQNPKTGHFEICLEFLSIYINLYICI